MRTRFGCFLPSLIELRRGLLLVFSASSLPPLGGPPTVHSVYNRYQLPTPTLTTGRPRHRRRFSSFRVSPQQRQRQHRYHIPNRHHHYDHRQQPPTPTVLRHVARRGPVVPCGDGVPPPRPPVRGLSPERDEGWFHAGAGG